MREGMRSEKATRGCGSIAIDVKEDSVAPWKREWLRELEEFVLRCASGMSEVTTATGCAVSRSNLRRSCRAVLDDAVCNGRITYGHV